MTTPGALILASPGVIAATLMVMAIWQKPYTSQLNNIIVLVMSIVIATLAVAMAHQIITKKESALPPRDALLTGTDDEALSTLVAGTYTIGNPEPVVETMSGGRTCH